MAIVKLQNTAFDNGFTGGSTATVTYPSALTSGSKLIAFASIGANQSITFSDSAGNTWNTLALKFNGNIPSAIAIGWADNTSSASGVVVTVTYGASGVSRTGGISEWTGLATGAPDVFTLGNTATTTTITDLSMTTTVAGDLIIAASASDNGSQTAGSGFTMLDYNSSTGSGWEYQIQSSAGSIAASIVQPTAGGAVIVSAAFKPSGGGGGPALPPELVMAPRRP